MARNTYPSAHKVLLDKGTQVVDINTAVPAVAADGFHSLIHFSSTDQALRPRQRSIHSLVGFALLGSLLWDPSAWPGLTRLAASFESGWGRFADFGVFPQMAVVRGLLLLRILRLLNQGCEAIWNG